MDIPTSEQIEIFEFLVEMRRVNPRFQFLLDTRTFSEYMFFKTTENKIDTDEVKISIKKEGVILFLCVRRKSDLYNHLFDNLVQKLNLTSIEVKPNTYIRDAKKFLFDFNENIKENLRKFVENELAFLGETLQQFSFKSIAEEECDSNIKEIQYLIKAPQLRQDVAKNQRPFSVCYFQIDSYKGIKNTKLIEIPSNSQFVFITGENAFGKTTLLQAIASSLDNDNKTDIDKDMQICLINEGEPSLINYNLQRRLIQVIANEKLHYGLACYGTERLDLQSADAIQEENEGITSHLFRKRRGLKNIENELIKWKGKENDVRYNQIIADIKQAIPYISSIEVKYSEKYHDLKVFYKENDEHGNEIGGFDDVQFHELAAGYRGMLALIGDILFRLSPEGIGSCAAKNLTGIVIIDEIELHLHPKYQRELPTLLAKTFPKIQFICSTHSPIILLGAPENSTFLKVYRSPKEEGIKIEKLEINISILMPNSILTSPLFDFQNLIPVSYNEEKELETNDDYFQILKIQERRKRLGIKARNFEEFI
jgi:energy-coupling factor transporter ATP-binding protein EcfA2